jgi:glycosyltransferase involved in cell wall biosynthesis
MCTDKINILWLATHPTQYQTPLLKLINQDNDINIEILFFSDFSINEYFDQKFKKTINWDFDLLDGLKYEFANRGEVAEISFTKPWVKNLKRKIRKGKYDYVFIQGWQHIGMILAAYWAKKYGKKVLMRCEATDHYVVKRNIIKNLLRKILIKFLFTKIDYFYAIGTVNKKFYETRRVLNDRIGWMPYCVDNDRFASTPFDRENYLRSLKLDHDKPTILYVGKLSKRKNVKQLLDAYLLLPAPRPNLLIVGTGEEEQELKGYCTAKSLHHVRFLGFKNQNELPEIYSISDIFVLPSYNEPWGLVINEAMNCGCAVITTKYVGAAYDLVINGKNGFVVNDLEVRSIHDAITKCLDENSYLSYQHASKKMIKNHSYIENLEGLKKGILGA